MHVRSLTPPLQLLSLSDSSSNIYSLYSRTLDRSIIINHFAFCSFFFSSLTSGLVSRIQNPLDVEKEREYRPFWAPPKCPSSNRPEPVFCKMQNPVHSGTKKKALKAANGLTDSRGILRAGNHNTKTTARKTCLSIFFVFHLNCFISGRQKCRTLSLSLALSRASQRRKLY